MKIGLFLKNLDEEYQLSIFKGVKAEAEALGMTLICVQGELLPVKLHRPEDLFPSIRFINFDGIIFLSSVLIDRSDIDYTEQLRKVFAGIPFVSVGDRFFDYHSIQIRVEKPMMELMEHIIVFHGYRKLLFINGPAEHHDSIVRERIFRKAVKKYRNRYLRLQGTVANGDFLEISGMSITMDYMQKNPDDPPDVIVAANDNMAIGAQNMLLTRDDPRWRNCPVTGFDDISQSGLEIPVLTTIRQPLDEMGSLAVRALYKLIKGKAVKKAIFTNAELIIRNSCGCSVVETTSTENLRSEELSLTKYRVITNQYHLRYLSILGRSLVVINTYGEMIQPLHFF